MLNYVFYGGTGQCKMMYEILKEPEHQHKKLVGIIDNKITKSPFKDVPLFKTYKKWKNQIDKTQEYGFIITIGNPHGPVRKKLYENLKKDGLQIIECIHKNCYIENGTIGIGQQIHSHVIINTNAKIGNYCILNTRALVEHDCILEDAVELGPNSTVCGEVHIGENTWIGAGAVVLPHLKIGKNVIVGAGTVVTKNIPDGMIVVGNPAKKFKKNGHK